MSKTVIESSRLYLRTEAPEDFDIWMAEINRPAVREYLRGVETAEGVRQSFDRMEKSQREENLGFWFVEAKDSGQLLGCCGLKRADSDGLAKELHGELEVGWLLREECWGQGLGTESAAASLDYAFATFGAERVIALTSRSNIGSWKIMEKLGMTYRPEWDFTDPDFPARDNPTIVYHITKTEWEQR